MQAMTLTRDEVLPEDRWNTEALYPSWKAWEEDYSQVQGEGSYPRWPELQKLEGSLKGGPSAIKQALDTTFSLERKLVKLYTYAHLRHDEEISSDEHKKNYGKAVLLLQDFQREISWMDPELLLIDEKTFATWLQDPQLKEFRFYLEKIHRLKAHTLPKEQEELLALASKALSAPHKAFSAINDADFVFGKIKDAEGKERELTHASYGIYIRDKDRTLRENAFKAMHGKFLSYENTIAELLSGQVQAHLFNARSRKYQSCVEAALYPKNIDTEVYSSLIEAVSSEIGSLHKYVGLRKRLLGLKELHMYDLYVPLTKTSESRYDYKEAIDAVIASVEPLGHHYQEILSKGLTQSRWVDRYENRHKRSGAYSSGCFDSMPYILMNYKGLLRDVFTLAHEAGHSMHSYFSRKEQPYHYSDYPIFVAEVASTFNEELLTRYLLKKAKTAEEKVILLNEKIEDIRATLFRQTLFAEFELWLHTQAEKGVTITPALLKEAYAALNRKYYGPDLVIDPEGEIEWARIPHFYYDFYVYQYATGLSASMALVKKVTQEGDKAREAYLTFLKGGSSQFPIDLLKGAGVDMRTAEPVKAAIGTFTNLVDQLEKELLALN